MADGDQVGSDVGITLFLAVNNGLLLGDLAANLADAWIDNSVAEVNRLVHKTTGASLSLGFTAMAGPLREIEKLAASGNLHGAAALHRRLTLNLDQTKQFLSA